MKIINFTQGSDNQQWLEWRRNGIGASDIGIIMGSNPYKTPLELWNQKCGYREEEPLNNAMRYGIENEPNAREWLNSNRNLNLYPLCIEDNKNSYMRASLDGYDIENHLIVEIKCPINQKALTEAKEYQKINPYWYHQIQWQIMLTDPKRAMVALWDPHKKECITVEMFGDPDLHDEMKEKAESFWRGVQMGKPPAPQKKDYLYLEDAELKKYLDEYHQLSSDEKVLSARKKELKSVIEEYGEGNNFKSFGFTITHYPPRVRYDLQKMKFDGIDIEAYAKKDSSKGYCIIKAHKSS